MNKVLAAVAAANDAYRTELLPYLFQHLQTCRPKDVPQHAEAIVRSVEAAHADAFVAVLVRRLAVMNATQAARLRRVILQVEASTGRHRVQQPSLAARPRRLCL